MRVKGGGGAGYCKRKRFCSDSTLYVLYIWLNVRNLVAYENHAGMQVYLTLSFLYENLECAKVREC